MIKINKLYLKKIEKNIKKFKQGFSLLELLVVILILGILAGLVIPKLLGKGEEAKINLVCIQMQSAKEALKMFKLDNGVFPDTEEGFAALTHNPDIDKYPSYSLSSYLESIPKDSWGTDMQYIKNENSFEIISFGADRKEGGTAEANDIYYSKCKK